MSRNSCLLALACAACLVGPALHADDRSYFITYDQHMEEPGSLELAFNPVFGHPEGGEGYAAAWLEIEYGTAGWWTTELYLTGQTTRSDSTVFTGWRLENRFRLLKGDHRWNPVFYIEYEDGNGADKTMQEVVGFDGEADQTVPNDAARDETERELELKAIAGTEVHGWNVSENLIAVKNLHGEPWEFGYAIGASRPFALAASPSECRFCAENFRAGLELYGGLGEQHDLRLDGTSHYVAPVFSWDAGHGMAFRVSPTFGLTEASNSFLLRIGFSYEFSNIGPRIGGRR